MISPHNASKSLAGFFAFSIIFFLSPSLQPAQIAVQKQETDLYNSWITDEIEQKQDRAHDQEMTTPANSKAPDDSYNPETALTLIEQDAKVANFIREEKKKAINQQRLYTVNLDKVQAEHVSSKKRLIQLERLGDILEQSPLQNYFVILSYDLQKLYLYKWTSIIASSKSNACLDFKKAIDSFQFFLNDACLLVTFNDHTSLICLLADTQRKAKIEQEKKENQNFLEEIRILEQYAPGARLTVQLPQLQKRTPAQMLTYPSRNHIITPCKDFVWNPFTIVTSTSTKNASQSTSSYTQWGCMSIEEAIQSFKQPEYSETELWCGIGINIFARENPPSIKILSASTDVLVQIDNHDIESYDILIGDPFIIRLYTTDKTCHIALVGEKTLIPIASGITDIIRGPQNHILVKICNSWFIFDINPSEPLQVPPPMQLPSPTSSSPETNSPALSATPSPSAPQRNLAIITNSNSGSPCSQRTKNTTQTETSQTTSSSTSAVSVCSMQ